MEVFSGFALGGMWLVSLCLIAAGFGYGPAVIVALIEVAIVAICAWNSGGPKDDGYWRP